MSLFPEGQPVYETFTSDPGKADIFFNGFIGSNDTWRWVISRGDASSKQKLISVGINFDFVLESYTTQENDKVFFHNIYSTKIEGVYLDLSFDSLDVSEEPAFFDKAKNIIVRRFGSEANRVYLDTLLSG
jgi:hypothetical protein